AVTAEKIGHTHAFFVLYLEIGDANVSIVAGELQIAFSIAFDGSGVLFYLTLFGACTIDFQYFSLTRRISGRIRTQAANEVIYLSDRLVPVDQTVFLVNFWSRF